MSKEQPEGKQPFRVINIDDRKRLAIFSNLDRPEEEVGMIREMLASKSKTIVPNVGVVETSDYTGDKRTILSDRLYQLLYTTQDVSPKEETTEKPKRGRPRKVEEDV